MQAKLSEVAATYSRNAMASRRIAEAAEADGFDASEERAAAAIWSAKAALARAAYERSL